MLGPSMSTFVITFIRENMTLDVIVVKYVSKVEQLADMLMEDLGAKRHRYVLQSRGVGPKRIQQ